MTTPPKEALPSQSESEEEAVQEATQLARWATRNPKTAKVLLALLVLSLLALGAAMGPAMFKTGARWLLAYVGGPVATPAGDSHDAGAGPAAADSRLRQLVAAEVQAQRQETQRLIQESEARTSARIDGLGARIDALVLTLARLRTGARAGATPTDPSLAAAAAGGPQP